MTKNARKGKANAKNAKSTAKPGKSRKPRKDPFAALRKAGTNGDNYDVSTADIIAWLKKWRKVCSFRIAGVDYNIMTLKFDTLPPNIKTFIRDAYRLCPDLCQVDDDLELPMLEKNLSQSRELTLWWD